MPPPAARPAPTSVPHPRPMSPNGRRGRLRRISRPQARNKSHHIVIEPNSREFGSFFRGSASEKTPLAQRSVRKPTSPQTGGLECAQRSAGLHRPAFQAGRGTLPWHEMPAGISASPYRLFPKSARNFLTSLSCQSLVGSRRPKKKRRLLGSSTQRRPPTSSRFSKSHVMRSTA